MEGELIDEIDYRPPSCTEYIIDVEPRLIQEICISSAARCEESTLTIQLALRHTL